MQGKGGRECWLYSVEEEGVFRETEALQVNDDLVLVHRSFPEHPTLYPVFQ